MNRRQFIKRASQRAIAACVGTAAIERLGVAGVLAAAPQPLYHLPDHLPKKLSIGMFIWNWITMATPGEPYHDLERAVAGLPERGFNAVRAEAGLNWCFRLDGRPRGEMTFDAMFPVYHDHMVGSAKGGGRHDVLTRVVRLMELAQKYHVYVILTSWEYQDCTSLVADPKIRAEVMGIPEPQRFMHLARQHDRLLRILKDKGLHKNIAFIEVHNEPDQSTFPQDAAGKKQHHEAIAFLHDAHPDILVSADYCSHDPVILPDNAQVYDQHTYVGLYPALYKQTIWPKDVDPTDPKAAELCGRLLKEPMKNDLLRRLLKQPFVPYDEFVKAAPNVRSFWHPICWLYHNLDVPRFDEWIAEQYKHDEARLKAKAVKIFADDAKEAARRKLPAVCDEGGYFLPVAGSKFELTPPGTSLFDLQVDLAIKHGYWGMMPTTYCGPEHPLWDDPQWLRTVNGRFQSGKMLNA